jgi:HAMP domain-containing protein
VYGSIFIVASTLAWVAAGGVLRPLRELRDTAAAISDSDLSPGSR